MSDARHFTAWLVNDLSALETGACDITIVEDEVISYDIDGLGHETPVWASQGEEMFHAVTTVDARDGDIGEAVKEAVKLMENAGWRVIGDWETTDNAYAVTVERD